MSLFLATHLLFFTSSVIASLAFYLVGRPSKWEIAGTFGGAVMLAWRFGLFGSGYAQVMVFLCYWRGCAFVATLLTPFVSPREVATRTRVLLQMAVPPFGIVASTLGLGLVSRLSPNTLDYYLYLADSSFGDQFGFTAGRLLARLPWLRLAAECAYINLPLALGVGYIAQLPEPRARFLRLLLLIGVIGYGCYLLFPGAGTIVLFAKRFPFDPPAASSLAVFQTPDLGAPRNCMPSLHAAWGLALWWSRPRGRWVQVALFTYVALLLLYTMSCGHYLVDVIAAAPFTVAIAALTGERRASRGLVAGAGAVLFVAWLLLVRFGTPVLMASVAVPWFFALATLGSCAVLRVISR